MQAKYSQMQVLSAARTVFLYIINVNKNAFYT